MIKKFYQSANSLKFSFPMTGLAFAIFVEAFLMTSGKAKEPLHIAMIVTAILLAIVMVFYYKNKFMISASLKKVQNLNDYEKGGMVDRSYFLEDRMLVCSGMTIEELQVKDVIGAVLEEKKYGKYVLHIKDATHFVDMSLLDRESAQRVAAYLKKRNPEVALTDVEPSGEGTLKELGAGY